MHFRMRMENRGRGGRVLAGVFLVIIGIVALMRSFEVPMPDWLFTWQTLLIVLGLFLGLKHGFKKGAWFVPILIGGAFLANDYFFNGELRRHIWPAVLIILGIVFIFRPRKRFCGHEWHHKKYADNESTDSIAHEANFSEDSFIDSTSIFGGSKKSVLTKDFKGGDIVNIFGGTELNLSQADINGKAVLEVTAIFGGATLTIPSNWTIKSEAVTVFGGVQDKRELSAINENPDKVLVLKGTVLFGGIEIKSF